LVCAAAQVVLDHVGAPGFLDDVTRKGTRAMQRLAAIGKETGGIVDVRGLGLLVGFDLTSVERADEVVTYARDHGVLLIKAGPATIRLVPPLNISDVDLETGLDVVDAALRK